MALSSRHFSRSTFHMTKANTRVAAVVKNRRDALAFSREGRPRLCWEKYIKYTVRVQMRVTMTLKVTKWMIIFPDRTYKMDTLSWSVLF